MNKLTFYYKAFEKVVQLPKKTKLLGVKIRQLKAMGVGMETSEAQMIKNKYTFK